MQSSFSPKARWDRHIPRTSETDSAHARDEIIDCVAFFKKGKIYPQKFVLNNRDYEIEKINYAWQERCGRELINYFSVSTGTNLYQISFNNTSFGWRLDRIIT